MKLIVKPGVRVVEQYQVALSNRQILIILDPVATQIHIPGHVTQDSTKVGLCALLV